jgi:hypothetical protein
MTDIITRKKVTEKMTSNFPELIKDERPRLKCLKYTLAHSAAPNKLSTYVFYVCLFLVVLGFHHWASSLMAGALPPKLLLQPCFVLGVFKIGSPEIFAWAIFEP